MRQIIEDVKKHRAFYLKIFSIATSAFALLTGLAFFLGSGVFAELWIKVMVPALIIVFQCILIFADLFEESCPGILDSGPCDDWIIVVIPIAAGLIYGFILTASVIFWRNFKKRS